MKHKRLAQCTPPMAVALFVFWSAACAADLVTQRTPSHPAPIGGGGDSSGPIVSPDGQWVLFTSTANDLATNATGNSYVPTFPATLNVYLRNRTQGTTVLISVNTNGASGGNGDSVAMGISTNGRYALFESTASNLVPGDTNRLSDVFLRDALLGSTALVSVNTNGRCAQGASRDPVMTPDGHYVAFVSTAPDLVPGDTNRIGDVFVRDTVAGTTVLATPGAIGLPSPLVGGIPTAPAGASEAIEITPNGRYIAFLSTATNVVPGNTNTGEVYVRDLVAGTTVAVSAGAHAFLAGAIDSYNHCLSDDGAFVAFESSPRVSSGVPPSTTGMVFRYNVPGNTLDRIAADAAPASPYRNTAMGTGDDSHIRDRQTVDMTPDGRFIAYVVRPDSTTITTSCVYVWDASSGTYTLASADQTGGIATDADCDLPTIDDTGRYVSFLSTATSLTTNTVSAGDSHLYVRDLQSATTRLVDVNPVGAGSAKDILDVFGLSADGRFIAFDSADSDLLPGDNNQADDVFLSDLGEGTIELVSARALTLRSLTPRGALSYLPVAATKAGRYVVFSSLAADLVDNDANGQYDVFVRDIAGGTNILISVNTNGVSAAGYSADALISSDGRYVAFCSRAADLVADDTNNLQNIFVRDLLTGTTVLGSTVTNRSPSNAYSVLLGRLLGFSADGRYLLFTARQLAQPNWQAGLFYRDLQLGITRVLSTNFFGYAAISDDGLAVAFDENTFGPVLLWTSQTGFRTVAYSSNTPSLYAISPQGNRVAYASLDAAVVRIHVWDAATGTNALAGGSARYSGSPRQTVPRFSADGRWLVLATRRLSFPYRSDVYIFDYETRSNTLISRSFITGDAADRPSDDPIISPDGRFVVYRSMAADLVPGITNHTPQRYIYDRDMGTTTLLIGDSAWGGQANSRAVSPVFSGDGRTLFFPSFASDIVPFDFDEHADVFSWKLVVDDLVPVFLGQIIFDPGSQPNPMLTWPALPGKTYEVQFKKDLSEPAWSPLESTIRIVGERGYATDFAPDAARRFYRISAY